MELFEALQQAAVKEPDKPSSIRHFLAACALVNLLLQLTNFAFVYVERRRRGHGHAGKVSTKFSQYLEATAKPIWVFSLLKVPKLNISHLSPVNISLLDTFTPR